MIPKSGNRFSEKIMRQQKRCGGGCRAPLASRSHHRRLLPWSALAGAGFLMLADLVARVVFAPRELPLGIVTAFAGAPFFLYLLRRAKNAAYF